MNSKVILLLGGLLSSLVVYICINNKEPTKITTPVKLTKTVPVEKKVVQENPSLYYVSGNTTSAKINFIDKSLGDTLQKVSQNNGQVADITYSEDFKPARWNKLASKSVNFFDKNNLKNLFIEASGNNITIKSDFKNKALFDKFNTLIEQNKDKNLNLTNLVKLKNPIDLSKIQSNINETLKLHPIRFAKSSSKITKDGIKNLEKIINTFLQHKNVRFDLVVEGHTDSTGSEKKNKILSQKRANSVKNYLQQNCYNLNNVESIGYGSSKPKYHNKKNPKNRRVEIIVQKGHNNGNI